ncbi:hypothetical protein V1477_004545 [Vespula maculifrons]|uniref:Uncharacterized protein n=1 Tax=Vespula maculifrons TaxID=7453 RepID=A0ABD2CM68_VESMC
MNNNDFGKDLPIHTSVQCHHLATRDTSSTQMSAVLSCGNVDFGVATPLQQYIETYRIAHTCDTTPQNIMAEKINIKLLIEEITKSHQRCCNAKILRCHVFWQNDATITSMQCRLQDVASLNARLHQSLEHFVSQTAHRNLSSNICTVGVSFSKETFRFTGDASTKSRKFDKGHVINSENIKKR